MGRLTSKPDVIKCDNSDNRYTRFTIAVERNYKSGDEKITDFINCTAWNNTAVFISKFFDKGNMIAVTGELNIDNTPIRTETTARLQAYTFQTYHSRVNVMNHRTNRQKRVMTDTRAIDNYSP